MNLQEMMQEFLSVPAYEITVQGYDTSELNIARTIFLNSLRNTLHKEIENCTDAKEIEQLISTFEIELENSLIIALYRRYLWLRPTDIRMYHNFIKYINAQDQKLLNYINNNDFNKALGVVEDTFNKLFIDNQVLIKPIELRTIINIAKELSYLEYDATASRYMIHMSAINDRYYYLLTQLKQRIVDHKTNIIELREFFTVNAGYEITLYCDVGLEIAKRYFNANPTDREMYGIFFHFLRFWHLAENEMLLLQYVAFNDFDNALKFINDLKI